MRLGRRQMLMGAHPQTGGFWSGSHCLRALSSTSSCALKRSAALVISLSADQQAHRGRLGHARSGGGVAPKGGIRWAAEGCVMLMTRVELYDTIQTVAHTHTGYRWYNLHSHVQCSHV
ncbi:hypothetical protein DM02DRAFT_610799, partial [Periconia macrospinosa]